VALNIFVFLFFGLMTGLLVYFPLRRAATKAALKPMVPFFAFISVVFLGNAFFAFLASRGLWAAKTMPSITSMGAFGDADDGAEIIVEGIVSIANPTVISNYVAYTGCDEETCNLGYVPSGMLIALDDGNVVIVNDDFEATAWPAANNPPDDLYSADFLAPGELVIIAGNKETGDGVHADVVYAGSHAAFVARARRRLVYPAVMLVLNLVGVVTAILLPMRRHRDIMRGGNEDGV
jgi:hypothetical protein